MENEHPFIIWELTQGRRQRKRAPSETVTSRFCHTDSFSIIQSRFARKKSTTYQ